MVTEPRTQDEIEAEIRSEIQDRTDKVTNFGSGTINEALVQAYAERIRELEVRALAVSLSASADFAGGELSRNDLNQLGIDNVTPEELNEYIQPRDLELLASTVGVERDTGSRARGQVTFQTTDDTVQIPEGFEVSTQPDSAGTTQTFLCDVNGSGAIEGGSGETVSPSTGETEVTVSVIADEVGSEYNVAPGQITRIPNPIPGVQSVTNPNRTSGGVPEQPLEEFRDDVRNALFESSGGGTKPGIEQEMPERSETGIQSVSVREFLDETPPFADVVVDGGTASEARDLIDTLKPAGVRHNFVRPTVRRLRYSVDVIGPGADPAVIQDEINNALSEPAVAEPLYETSVELAILSRSSPVESVSALRKSYDEIDSERQQYSSGTAIYALEYGPLGKIEDEAHVIGNARTEYPLQYGAVNTGSVTVTARFDNNRRELTSSEFSVTNNRSSVSGADTVELTGVTPDLASILEVNYEHDQGSVDEVRSIDGSTVYTEGTDYAVIDDDGDGLLDSIEWLSGSTPADGERFEIDYKPRRTASGELRPSPEERISSSGLGRQQAVVLDLDSTIINTAGI